MKKNQKKEKLSKREIIEFIIQSATAIAALITAIKS